MSTPQPPACTQCGRTVKTAGESAGQPVEIAQRGRLAGWCKTCRWKVSRGFKPGAGPLRKDPEHEPKETREGAHGRVDRTEPRMSHEWNERTLETYMRARRNRLTRHQRRAKHPTVA